MLDQLTQVVNHAGEVGADGRVGAEAGPGCLDENADPGELLTDVVVEIEAEALALLLADAHLSMRQVAQLLFAGAQCFFDAAAFGDVPADAADADDLIMD